MHAGIREGFRLGAPASRIAAYIGNDGAGCAGRFASHRCAARCARRPVRSQGARYAR
nr:MAG TPA: hypothetical protein [Caudoviricetes sp.]